MNLRVATVASVNQGREFPGSVNPNLAMDFFKKQSEPWEGIARFHLKLVSDCCISFVERLFQHIVGGDADTLQAILRLRVDTWFETKRETLETKLQELLRPYKGGYVVALEQEMHTKTDTRTIHRLIKQAQRFLGAEDVLRETGLRPMDLLRGLDSAGSPMTSQFGTEKVIDLMMAHYDVSHIGNGPHLALELTLGLDVSSNLHRQCGTFSCGELPRRHPSNNTDTARRQSHVRRGARRTCWGVGGREKHTEQAESTRVCSQRRTAEVSTIQTATDDM
jgi:hypothetical protein